MNYFEYLNILYKIYEYILTYLSHFIKVKRKVIEKRLKMSKLYKKLILYDIFLFIFFYKKLIIIMIKIYKQLQLKDIQIHDIEN